MKVNANRFGLFFISSLWLVFGLVAPPFVNAQVGPQIFMQPWQEGAHWAETVDELLFFERGYVKHTDLSTKIWSWDSSGRIRLSRQDPAPGIVIGYRINTMEVDSEAGAINGDLWDVAIVGGVRLGRIADRWEINLLGGAGTSQDNHWTDSDAIYPLAALDVSTALDEHGAFHFGIDYDGNRVLWPDIPLPYAAYVREWNSKWTTTLGLPTTSITYKPLEWVRLAVDYDFPDALTVGANLALLKNVILFAQYSRGTLGFHIHQREDERLFYELQRVSVGVRWITKLFDASLGAGYGLEQQFDRGFDLTDTRKLAELNQQPFFSIKIVGTF